MNFIDLCKTKNITVISKLQERQIGKDHKSEVWLIRDYDGLFKVLKDFTDYSHLVGYLNEDELCLPVASFLPVYYGITFIGDQKFIRRSFVYGQLLADYCYDANKLLPKADVFFIISDLVAKLKILQNINILFLDLRPENILIAQNEVRFFDLGLSRLKENDDFFKAVVAHPRFTAPEIVLESLANSKSVIFQLGLIAHELLYGKHPFDIEQNNNLDWNYGVDHYIEHYLKRSEIKVEDEFIQRMLSYEINERPSLDDCIGEFKPGPLTTSLIDQPVTKVVIHRKNVWKSNSKSVLFPARMGIPHRGHIDFIAGLLDLGFKLIISIQRTYTITNDDPIPKWLVMKIIAQSLLEAGYPEESFKFYLTPFYATDKELSMHFTMLPDKFDFVASSNDSIRRFFPVNIITQKDVLGFEDIKYEDRSWGKIVRSAVSNDDYATFKEYAASGIENILTFKEIKENYNAKPEELFVFAKNVYVELFGLDNQSIVSNRVPCYSTPEVSLGLPIMHQYSKYSSVLLNNNVHKLLYKGTTYSDNRCTVIYQLRKNE